jgi:acetyl esterase/lipase
MRHTKTVCVDSLVGHSTGRKLRWAALGLALAQVVGAHASGAVVVPNIVFPSPGSPGNVQVMDLYRPSNGPEERCTIILAHTGSYAFGDKSELAGICARLADRGYAVITTNYMLVTPATSGVGQGTFPQPTVDVLNAVHWVRAQGQAFGLPSRVIIGGFSAGSTIAVVGAMSATVASAGPFNPLAPAGPRGYLIDGAIGCFGRYDFQWNAQTYGIPGYVMAYLGLGSANLSPADANSPTLNAASTFSAASATAFVNHCSPPTVLIHGDADPLVPVGHTYRLSQALQQAGVPVRMQIVPGGGHSMGILGPNDTLQAQTIENAVNWILDHQQLGCGRDNFPPPPPPPPVGQCCFDSGICVMIIADECSGSWDVNSTCVPNVCPAPPSVGACCMGASCLVRFSGDCVGPGTSFYGANIPCNSPANTSRPCCRADFNQDGQLSINDVFAYIDAWFTGDPSCVVDDNFDSGPTIGHIFLFLNGWFAGC